MKPLRSSSALALSVVAILLAGVAGPRAEEPAAIPPGEVPAAAVVPSVAAPAEVPASPAPAPEVTSGPVAEEPARPVPAVMTASPAPRDAGGAPLRIGEPRLDPVTGRFVAAAGKGRATLTLDARLQEKLERSLETYRVPWGATVLLEPRTGRVLAMAEHSQAEPGKRGLALTALAPAASVFKIVTAAALLERGAAAADEVCWHGGKRRLQPKLLVDDPRRDHRCSSLTSAFGHSTNVVFAKLADRDLDPETLRATAQRFLFNAEIPFERPVDVSIASVPDDPFAAANTAAGFGSVRLSPLHGALLAAIVANGGVFVPPALVDEGRGEPPAGSRRVIDAQVAAQLAEMMRETVTSGTARKVFRRVAAPLRGVSVAGKTGSLADARPYRDYSWFVGYAPADRPEVAIATVVVNDRLWHARAPTVAKEALEAFFATRALHAGGGAVRTAAVR